MGAVLETQITYVYYMRLISIDRRDNGNPSGRRVLVAVQCLARGEPN